MITPKIKVEVKNTALMDRLLKQLPKLKKAYVTVGFHEDAEDYPNGESVVEVALWNEFGTKPHPSAFGIVHSPERSFIRSAIDDNIAKINQWREEALVNIIEKGMDPKQALDAIGYNVQVLIQNRIKSGVEPENTDATKDAKKKHGSTNWGRTLMDTEHMLKSVSFHTVVP